MDNQHIIIFDGVCNFCNKAVNFIIKRDPSAIFVFTPMQSALAKQLMKKHKIDTLDSDSLVLIKNQQCFLFSDAVLEIAKDLNGFWRLFQVFKFIPRVIRHYLYKQFGRNRYALFGKTDSCMIPSEEIRSRFIGL